MRKALLRAKLTLDRIDLFELNEAFAAQALACQRSSNGSEFGSVLRGIWEAHAFRVLVKCQLGPALPS